MPIPLLLAPLLSKLAESGLSLIGNAVLNKGKEVVEKKLGVSLDDLTATEEGKLALLQAQTDREEDLLQMAIEDRKLDLDFYKVAAEDTADARKMGVALSNNSEGSLLSRNIVPVLALIIVIGGGAGIIWSPDSEVKMSLVSVVSLVVGYYFGTSKGSDRQAATIQNLSQGVAK